MSSPATRTSEASTTTASGPGPTRPGADAPVSSRAGGASPPARATSPRATELGATELGAGLPAAWWPLAASHEITGRPRSVMLAGRPLAVYRDSAGAAYAVADRCPHRRLPLSLGRVTEDGLLQCGYHGWSFDGATGRCTLIPNFRPGEQPNSRIKVASFPVAEADPFVLVWSGSGALQDPPDWLTTPGARRRAAVIGAAQVRAPHRHVAGALAYNPGAALGLGWLFGGGDEMASPLTIEAPGGATSIRRERLTFALRAPETFEPPLKRITASRTTIATGGSLIRVDTDDALGVRDAQLVLGLTPVDEYRTAIHWQLTVSGPARRPVAATVRAVLTRGSRVVSNVERAADGIVSIADPVVDMLGT